MLGITSFILLIVWRSHEVTIQDFNKDPYNFRSPPSPPLSSPPLLPFLPPSLSLSLLPLPYPPLPSPPLPFPPLPPTFNSSSSVPPSLPPFLTLSNLFSRHPYIVYICRNRIYCFMGLGVLSTIYAATLVVLGTVGFKLPPTMVK